MAVVAVVALAKMALVMETVVAMVAMVVLEITIVAIAAMVVVDTIAVVMEAMVTIIEVMLVVMVKHMSYLFLKIVKGRISYFISFRNNENDF